MSITVLILKLMPEQEFAKNQESGIRPPNNKTQL